jgi:hypothetical protein
MSVAAVVAAALTLLVGCAGIDDNGPLVVPFDEDGTCVPAETYPVAAIGTILTNSSAGDLTITRVEPIEPENVTVGEQSLMPSPGMKLLADKYPPIEQFPDDWPNAESIDRAVVAAYEDDLVLVSEVAIDDDVELGTLAGFEIYYVDETGAEYVERTAHYLRIKRGGC